MKYRRGTEDRDRTAVQAEKRRCGESRIHAPDDFGASPRIMLAGWTVVAGAALLLLWLALAYHRVGDYLTESDFYGGYAEGAAMIRHGRLDAARYQVVGPVYEIVVALASFVVPDFF